MQAAEVSVADGPNPPTAEAEEIAYEQGIRSLDQQAQVIDSIRSRTGVLVAATALVATLLGGRALTVRTDQLWLELAALLPLLAFGWGLYVAICVLRPTKIDPDTDKSPDARHGLQLTINAQLLLERPEARGEGNDTIRAFVARCAQDQWDGNVTHIDRLLDLFVHATWALLAQAGLWIALLIGKEVI